MSLSLDGKPTSTPQKKALINKSKATSFDDIISSYLFIGDFSTKSESPSPTGDNFWRYPFKFEPFYPELDLKVEDIKSKSFRVIGGDELAKSMAKSRNEFLSGNIVEAQETLSQARSKWGLDPLMNRRSEFHLALINLTLLAELLKDKPVDYQIDEAIKKSMTRCAYFLSAVFILRKDLSDPEIDKHTLWGLYNLAVLYHKLERWSIMVGAIDQGLTEHLKQGRSDFRAKLRRMLAEIFIKGADYLSAIQEIDTTIRQDKNQKTAAQLFARAGDIYYALNNFDLAAAAYEQAHAIDKLNKNIDPTRALFYGESKFWLGQYADASKLLDSAERASLQSNNDWLASSGQLSWLGLRRRDAASAMARTKEDLSRVRLGYFQVEEQFKGSEPARIAKVRGICTELPTFEGNNVRHAREELQLLIKENLPEKLMESTEACYTESYSQREKTDLMVEKVKQFADKYPQSKALERMIPAVVDVKSETIQEYFSKKQYDLATELFEKRRNILYQNISPSLAKQLFVAYTTLYRSEKANEFWTTLNAPSNKSLLADLNPLLVLSYLADTSPITNPKTPLNNAWKQAIIQASKPSIPENANNSELLRRIIQSQPSNAEVVKTIFGIISSWNKDREWKRICDEEMPLLQKLKKLNPNKDPSITAVLKSQKSSAIKDLLAVDTSCFHSWIQLERETLNLTELKSNYLERAEWPLTGPWLESVWLIAEKFHQNKQSENAQALWQKIVKDAGADTIEHKLAKDRLDEVKPESEKIWK